MATKTIPQLTDVVTVTATVLFEISMGGTTYKMSDTEFVTWLYANFGIPNSASPNLAFATGQDGQMVNFSNNARVKVTHDGNVLIECLNGQNVFLENLPTADPMVSGAVWSNSGVLTLSP